MGDEHPAPRACPDGDHVPSGLSLPDIPLEGVEPPDLVRSSGQILVVLNLETDRLEGFPGLRQGTHLRDTISKLDLVS